MIAYDTRIDYFLKHSHRMLAKVELWGANGFIKQLRLIDGNVRVDDKDIRRRASVQIADPMFDLAPDDLLDELAPTGNEIRCYRGIRVKGEDIYVLLGVFTIDDVRVDSSGDSHQIHLDCYDRARRVQRALLNNDYVINAGTNVATAVQNLVSDAVPSTTFKITSTSETTNKVVMTAGDDRWSKARQLATSIGYEVFFDEAGVCVFRPVVGDSADPVWSYDVDAKDNMMLYANKRMHNNTVWNHVVVTGESTSSETVFRGEAFDNNPASPTYVYGRFGDIVHHVASSDIKSNAQAQAMADALLTKGLGIAEEVNTISVPHPAHEVGDHIYLNLPRAALSGTYVIEAITIPLSAMRGLNIKCKQRMVTA